MSGLIHARVQDGTDVMSRGNHIYYTQLLANGDGAKTRKGSTPPKTKMTLGKSTTQTLNVWCIYHYIPTFTP